MMKMLGCALVLLLAATCSASPDCDACSADRAEYCDLFPTSPSCTSGGCGWAMGQDGLCWLEADAPHGSCCECSKGVDSGSDLFSFSGAGASDCDACCTSYSAQYHSGEARPARTCSSHSAIVHSAGCGQQQAAPIIGGQGKYRYQYMPDLLKPPPGAALVNCHGLSVDKDENIILTYQNDGKDPHCIIRWNPDGTGGEFASKDTPELCSGTPHGLKITTEQGEQYLYHANNQQKLAKTTLDGEIVWIRDGNFGQDDTCTPATCPNASCACSGGKKPYIPTWFATPADSKYIYLCDGYGSDEVYAFDSTNGEFMNMTWGGRSPAGLHPGVEGAQAQPHGKFMENHGCTW